MPGFFGDGVPQTRATVWDSPCSWVLGGLGGTLLRPNRARDSMASPHESD